MDDYTETGAGAANLTVDNEENQALQSTLGVSLRREVETATGLKMVPEAHVAWLHEFLDEEQVNTSTFTGGGGSFTTRGFDPANDSFNIGASLAIYSENNIDVKFAILNNGTLGLVRQLQDLFYGGEFVATLYSGNPDFVKIAEAYGITGFRVTDKAQVAAAIQRAMDTPGPVIVDFIVKQDEHVFPMIPAGESVNEMMEQPAPQRITK